MSYFTFVVVGYLLWSCVPHVLRERRRKEAEASVGIKAAAKYWADNLRPGFIDISRIQPDQPAAFQRALELSLINLYARDGKLPDIGVFYYEPYHYGVDPVIWNAMRAARIVFGFNRDIDHGLLGAVGRMRVTLSGYQFVEQAA